MSDTPPSYSSLAVPPVRHILEPVFLEALRETEFDCIVFADHDPHPSWIATSTATRHEGTHRGNRLLGPTAAPTQFMLIRPESLFHMSTPP